MSERDFTYWLQGYFELSETGGLSEKQVEIIKEHLSLVFQKKTTSSLSDLAATIGTQQSYRPQYC